MLSILLISIINEYKYRVLFGIESFLARAKARLTKYRVGNDKAGARIFDFRDF